MHDKLIQINKDSFSSGQISSKLWLCQELEKHVFAKPQKIWVFGGWYGIASLLLLSRQNIAINEIRSFDIDPNCEMIADTLLENWVWKNWQFKAITCDCNHIVYDNDVPDIIINCSTEHFDSDDWWKNIPSGTMTVIQSNNMPHEEHVSCLNSVDDLAAQFTMQTVTYKGTIDFHYPTWSFSRFMVIGIK
jgi:hypothetical protein